MSDVSVCNAFSTPFAHLHFQAFAGILDLSMQTASKTSQLVRKMNQRSRNFFPAEI
jgi:hypothetical protein